jgi:hypothetical protein
MKRPQLVRRVLATTLFCLSFSLVWNQSSSTQENQSPTTQQSQSPTTQETQTPTPENFFQMAPTKSDIDHASEDIRNVQKLVKSMPKEQRDAAITDWSKFITSDPSVSDDLKQVARENPDKLLNTDPKDFQGKDIVKTSPTIQQVMDPSLPPFVVVPGGVPPSIPPGTVNPLVRLMLAKYADLAKKAESVGRIETVQSGGYPRLIGTAFVVGQGGGRGYLMTACHVVKDIAKLNPTTKMWNLVSSTYIDFGSTMNHSPSKEFVVHGVSKMSSIRGFDVAVLQVELKSRDSISDLPANLDLDSQGGQKQIPIAVVGYPSFDDTQGTPRTLEVMARVKAANPDGAKFMSPGRVLSNEDRTSFHILVHVSSTHGGNSGSPVFSLNPIQVVGVHYCCTGPDDTGSMVPPPDTGDCSSSASADIHSNEAISAADARSLIPVLTASTEVGKQHQSTSAGSRVLIVKPFSAEGLFQDFGKPLLRMPD